MPSESGSRHRSRRALMAIVGVVLSWGVSGCATSPRRTTLTAGQKRLNVASFDEIWTTIRDTHWDPALGGLDWDALRDEYRPRVASAGCMSDARKPMNDLIARLQQTHFEIIPSELYADFEVRQGEGHLDGGIGVDVRVIDGRALVTSVDEDSPADRLGVRPGWVIVAVDGVELDSKIETLSRALAGATTRDARLAYMVGEQLLGEVGGEVRVAFLDGDDRRVTHDLARAGRRGKRCQLGLLEPYYIWFESRRTEDNIGYIAFEAFMDPATVMGGFNEAMTSFMDADGIIIDLRGNPGGIGAMSIGMAGWLVPEKNKSLGTMTTRHGQQKFIVNRRAQTYDGPLVLLIDGLTGSTAEIFAGGLKDLGRATVIGSRSSGAALPATMSKLPNGDGFLHAFANYVSHGGQALEGVGVSPHIEAAPSRDALLAGRDVAMERAVEVIKNRTLTEIGG